VGVLITDTCQPSVSAPNAAAVRSPRSPGPVRFPLRPPLARPVSACARPQRSAPSVRLGHARRALPRCLSERAVLHGRHGIGRVRVARQRDCADVGVMRESNALLSLTWRVTKFDTRASCARSRREGARLHRCSGRAARARRSTTIESRCEENKRILSPEIPLISKPWPSSRTTHLRPKRDVRASSRRSAVIAVDLLPYVVQVITLAQGRDNCQTGLNHCDPEAAELTMIIRWCMGVTDSKIMSQW
jgi:hypothetical protein